AGQRLGQNLPLPGRIDLERGIVLHHSVEQQVLVEMTKGRELARHRAIAHSIGKQLAQKSAHIFATGLEQRAATGLQKFGELDEIGLIRFHAQSRQALLDFEVVEKAADRALVSLVHCSSISRFRASREWQHLSSHNQRPQPRNIISNSAPRLVLGDCSLSTRWRDRLCCSLASASRNVLPGSREAAAEQVPPPRWKAEDAGTVDRGVRDGSSLGRASPNLPLPIYTISFH